LLLQYYLPEVQKRFVDYILNSQPSSIKAKSPITTAMIDKEICGKIGDHEKLQNGEMDSQTLEKYLDFDQSCSALKDHSFIKNISNFDYNIKDVYSNMSAGFRSEIWAKLPSDRIDAGLWSNAVSALNALIFSNYQMEINRWNSGNTTLYNCKSS
jgi:hypothetical protein